MMLISCYKSQIRKLVLYCLIGLSGVTVDALVFLFLTSIPVWHSYYLAANAISVTCGITNNFILNAFFNFKKTDNIRHRFICFFVTGIFGLLIASLIIYVLADVLLIGLTTAKLVSIFFVTMIQFLLNYFISFRDISKA